MKSKRSLKTSESRDEALGEPKAQSYHVPVLLKEVLEYLEIKPDGTYVDATLGGGGYAEAMLGQIRTGSLFGFETDPAAQQHATDQLAPFQREKNNTARFELISENFGMLQEALAELRVDKLDGIVYDLGVSSHQLDTNSIGLSYRVEGPLDMRLDPRLELTAEKVIAEYEEEELRRVFREYGEEPRAGQIANRIVRTRLQTPIKTTTEFAAIVGQGIREDKRNATLSRIFQALRIEINEELAQLERSLQAAISLLKPQGKIVVVSYHSLEDRIVKNMFHRASAPLAEPGSPTYLMSAIDHTKATLRLLTKRPVVPSEEETARNGRARSAKLRAAEKI